MSQEKNTFHLLQPRPYPSKLSLVIPMYNEEAVIPLLRPALEQFMNEVGCETEIILVNDGSYDATIEKLSGWAREDPRIKVVHFSRNFGHQFACTAGLDYASGDAAKATTLPTPPAWCATAKAGSRNSARGCSTALCGRWSIAACRQTPAISG